MKSSKAVERIAQALTICSFVLLCWVANRSLEPRSACVNSSFISLVQIDGVRVGNCLYENRLSPRNLFEPLSHKNESVLRSLEITEPLAQLITGRRLGLAVDVTERDPDLFELGKGYVRIGSNWLKDPTQLRRALTMGILRNEFPQTYGNQFQLEVVTDFLLLTIFGQDEWRAEDIGDIKNADVEVRKVAAANLSVSAELPKPPEKIYSLVRDMRFSTMSPSFEQYCMSPFRSLSHRSVCHMNGEHDLAEVNVWGFRPLLAVSLYRVFNKLSISEQMHVMSVLRSGAPLPALNDLKNATADTLVAWFQVTLSQHLTALLPANTDATGLAVRRTLKELEVESPTHWELTLDLTATPVWREIVEQMRTRAKFKKERVLIFTPEGAKALPSGLPVAWAADEISTQKHVLIACNWPAPEDTVHVRARKVFAQQSCAKLTTPFWD